jgi:hypothetical protein
VTRRRILLATTAALLAAGTVGAASATADTPPSPGVRMANDNYIACAGLETVNVAACVESPTGLVLDLLRRP